MMLRAPVIARSDDVGPHQGRSRAALNFLGSEVGGAYRGRPTSCVIWKFRLCMFGVLTGVTLLTAIDARAAAIECATLDLAEASLELSVTAAATVMARLASVLVIMMVSLIQKEERPSLFNDAISCDGRRGHAAPRSCCAPRCAPRPRPRAYDGHVSR